MGRNIDPESARNKAMVYLNKNHPTRGVAIAYMMTTLKIGETYAGTIFTQYREAAKKSGVIQPVYSILDIKRGKQVAPYIKMVKTIPSDGDCTTVKKARKVYTKELKARGKLAKALGNDDD